jgi:hypothetical protein
MESITLTQVAEEQLIEKLLRFPLPLLMDEQVRRHLAAYPYKVESERIQAIRQIIRILKPLRRGTILLDSFATFEGLMLSIGKRDHFIHQFEVFLLGWYVFCALLGKSTSRSVDIDGFAPIKTEEFFTYWLLAAMMHDLGFSFQESPKIIEEMKKLHRNAKLMDVANLYHAFGKMLNSRSKQNHLPWVENLWQGRGKLINQHLVIGLQHSLRSSQKAAMELAQAMATETDNHGYISALLVGHALYPPESLDDPGPATPDSKLRSIHLYRLLLAAISLHHIKADTPEHENILRNIRYSANPFAYLLFAMDNLQEWARLSGTHVNEPAPMTFLTHCISKGRQITLNFVTRHDLWGTKIRRKTLKEIKAAQRRLKMPIGPACGIKLKILYFFNDIEMNCGPLFLDI